ncbi:MAG: hypothetical protein ACTSYC_01775 [Promethearchaeota archaeon]
MSRGCFCYIFSDLKVLGQYFKEEYSNFKISNDLLLRLNLDHEKNEYNYLKIKDIAVLSYLHEITSKLHRNLPQFVLAVLLEEGEDPERFRPSLKKAAQELEELDLLSLTREEFDKKLKEIHEKHVETLLDILNPENMKERVINRTKNMLSGGRKKRKLAQELLEKIEEKLPEKLYSFYTIAEESFKSKDHEKAAKNFLKAAEVADELLEKELSKVFRERARISREIPYLSKQMEEFHSKAKNALRNEDFHQSYVYYKKASEIAKELMLVDKEEELRLKSKALQEFHQVDQRFRKNK